MSQLQAVKIIPNFVADDAVECILCGESAFVKTGFCVECRRASELIKVPTPADFYDKEGRETDFLLSPELARIGRILIRNYTDDFMKITNAEIDYFWKAKGGASGGRNTLGKCKKVSGELKFYSEKDFLIWIAADHCYSFDYYKLTAIVFHELKHCGLNENGKYEIVGHDAELFNREVEVFGAWKYDLEKTAKSFAKIEQPGLFE